jgi:hypothetical protein
VEISRNWQKLTITSNDLVKAVAAVNKNVIVVGEWNAVFRRCVWNSH